MKCGFIYDILTQSKWGRKGINIMAKKEVCSYLEELEKKRNNAIDFNYGALLLAGIGGAATIMTGVIGGTGAIAANIGYDIVERQVVDSESFEAMNFDKRNAIVDDFSMGKISYDEYQARLNALYSKEAIVDYAKNSGNHHLAQTANSYEKSKDLGDTVLGKGVPTMASFLGMGLAGCGISEYLRRKYERRILEYKAQQEATENSL